MGKKCVARLVNLFNCFLYKEKQNLGNEKSKIYRAIKIISQNELDEKIRKVKQNELSVQELIDCLDSKHMYINSNTINLEYH